MVSSLINDLTLRERSFFAERWNISEIEKKTRIDGNNLLSNFKALYAVISLKSH